MFEPAVCRGRIHGRYQTQLTDLFQSLERRRINDSKNARRNWDIDLVGNPNRMPWAGQRF